MIVPGVLDLAADRWTPFRTTLPIIGIDLTDAVFEAHVRLTKDTPGDPLVDLDTVMALGDEGIYLVGVATVDGETISTLSMHIDEANMALMPDAAELGDDLNLAWDMQITPDGGLKQVYFSGLFIVRASVTGPVGT